jgi:hypothetical protein
MWHLIINNANGPRLNTVTDSANEGTLDPITDEILTSVMDICDCTIDETDFS